MPDARFNTINSSDNTIESPATSAEAITPHATNALTNATRAIYFGTAGTVVVRMLDDTNDTTFANVLAGTVLPIRVSHVRSGPANMVALF